MTTVETSTFINSVVTMLTEAYAGPPNPKETWFIDNEPDSGILGILKTVTAAEASTSMDGSGDSGSTIASHVEHLRWSLANTNASMRGQEFNSNWSESWELRDADQAAWDRLRQALRSEFETLRDGMKSQTELPDIYVIGGLALVAHSAFHLGVIRQMIERVREKQS